jgi:tetratricopeptide (TPR) repeat protein
VAQTQFRQIGDDHFYNLEYREAIENYKELVRSSPADLTAFNQLASAYLYQELFRTGRLDTGTLGTKNRYLGDRQPIVQEKVKLQILDALSQGRDRAERALASNPQNSLALYGLCINYGLRATYDVMIDKSWFAAFRHGSEAKTYCARVRDLDPEFADCYLVLGLYEYAGGALPWSTRWLAAMGGVRGSKEKGIEYVQRAATAGVHNRGSAQILLAMLYRRERRPVEAARILEQLAKKYPRNYLVVLELASAYREAGQSARASAVFRVALRKVNDRVPNFHLMPVESVQQITRSTNVDAEEGIKSDPPPSRPPARTWD